MPPQVRDKCSRWFVRCWRPGDVGEAAGGRGLYGVWVHGVAAEREIGMRMRSARRRAGARDGSGQVGSGGRGGAIGFAAEVGVGQWRQSMI